MSRASRAVTRILRQLGVDVRRWPAPEPSYLHVARILDGVDVILDVGANTGQYARHIRGAGFAGRIISIEPAPAAFAVLQAAANETWSAVNIALGDRDGDMELIVYNRSDMNSSRPLSDAGRAVFPRLEEVARVPVPVRRLDSIFDQLVPSGSAALKIDAQGAEIEVLAGASAVLSRIPVIQVEMAHQPLYDGAPVFEDTYDLLRSHGYRLAMTSPVTFDKTTGRPIEIDGIFVR